MLLLEQALAAWRLAYMLVEEEGPSGVLRSLRRSLGVVEDDDGFKAAHADWTPLHCVCCTSIYCAVLMLVLPGPVRRVLAVAGAATLAQKAMSRYDR